jgi:hypothetical protein
MTLPPVHLVIVQPNGYVHSLGLLDQARYFRWQFRRLGAEVTIAKNRLRPDAVNFVFGAHLGFAPEEAQRHTCIFVNLEQLGDGGARVRPEYIELLRRSAVVDYDAANVASYASDPADVPLIGFLHAPYLDDGLALPLEERPIDLLFFGSINARREAWFAQVEAAGVEITRFDHPVYGAERDHFIRQAKAVLNCHFYETSRFEQARAFACLSMGTPVISERAASTLAPAGFDASVFWLADGQAGAFFAEQFGRPAFFDTARAQLAHFRTQDPLEAYADLLAFAIGYQRAVVERRQPAAWRPTRLAGGEGYCAGWLNVATEDGAVADLTLDLARPLPLPLTLRSRDGAELELQAGQFERIELDAARWPQGHDTVLRNVLALLGDDGVFGVANDADGRFDQAAAAFWRHADFRLAARDVAPGGPRLYTKTPLTFRERTLARMQRDDFGGLPADEPVRADGAGTAIALPAAQPELTVVCVSYRRYDNIPILIHSFLTQTLQSWKLLILHDGYDEKMDRVLARYKAEHPGKIDYRFTDQRHNDYGHSLRDIGIRMADTEYLLITNDDNYYCPRFVELMLPDMKAHGADIALCNMIHSHERPGLRPQPSYMPFETRPERGSVDIGSFIARTDWARRVGFRDKSHDGDATYFEDLLRCAERPKVLKVERTLFVHN